MSVPIEIYKSSADIFLNNYLQRKKMLNKLIDKQCKITETRKKNQMIKCKRKKNTYK